MTQTPQAVSHRGTTIRALHLCATSFVIPYTLGTAFLLFVLAQLSAFRQGWHLPANALYLWLRSGAKINDTLHLYHPDKYSGLITPGSAIGIAIAELFPVLLAASLLYILLHAADGLAFQKLLLNRLGGITALLAPPLFALLCPSWPHLESPKWIFLGELLLLIVALLLRKELGMLRLWILILMTAIHAAFWGLFLFDSAYFLYGRLYAVLCAPVISVVAVAVWILYLRGPTAREPQKTPKPAWVLVAATLATNLLLFVPWPGPKLVEAKDRNTLEVTMSRTGCFGSCPTYELSIHGDGRVDYEGHEFVWQCGKTGSSLRQLEVEQILEALDEARFFSMEDRAFTWTSDVPAAIITVKLNGKTKTVRGQWSVYFDVGLSKTQMEFAGAANKIDEIVGSKKWIGDGRGYHHCPEPSVTTEALAGK